MTISIQANAAGTAGQINIGATPVVNIPVASGLPFCKNKLFNGEVTRINQRAFDGNWVVKNIWAGGNTLAQQELCYGWDMWAKASATDMLQPIEAGNYRPSTVHTISGIGITPFQITSPASGNWNIIVPQTARNIQVEEGSVATPFEIRPTGFELEQCQRYFESLDDRSFQGGGYGLAGNVFEFSVPFLVVKRASPSIGLGLFTGINVSAYVPGNVRARSFSVSVAVAATGPFIWGSSTATRASAVI